MNTNPTNTLGPDERAELESLRKEVSTLRAQHQQSAASLTAAHQTIDAMKLGREVEVIASAMGFEYPDIAVQLIDPKALSTDPETGETRGIRDALQAILDERPGLRTAAPRGGTPPRTTANHRPLHGDAPGARVLTPAEDLLTQGEYF